jgi:hypothetical protein
MRSCSPVLLLEAPPAPPLSAPAAGVAVGGDPDDRGGDSGSSFSTDLSAEQELEGWVARPITRDCSQVSLPRRARHPAAPGTRPAYLVH